MILLLLLTMAVLPRESVVWERCAVVDVVELNHFYDDNGQPVFDQVIYYDWDGARHQVRDWWLVKDPGQLPQRDWARGGYVALWFDDSVLRQVRAASLRETWTQYDPVAEREVLPKEQRRLLQGEKKP